MKKYSIQPNAGRAIIEIAAATVIIQPLPARRDPDAATETVTQ
jgi:hypothetical protein